MPTAPAARAMKAIQTAGYRVRMETYSCRNIAGTNRKSQHSYDNAIDIFGDAVTREAVYRYLDRNRGTFSIATLCYQSRGPCNAASHQDHVHVDFLPTLSGPCRRGSATVDNVQVLPDSGGGVAVVDVEEEKAGAFVGGFGGGLGLGLLGMAVLAMMALILFAAASGRK